MDFVKHAQRRVEPQLPGTFPEWFAYAPGTPKVVALELLTSKWWP